MEGRERRQTTTWCGTVYYEQNKTQKIFHSQRGRRWCLPTKRIPFGFSILFIRLVFSWFWLLSPLGIYTILSTGAAAASWTDTPATGWTFSRALTGTWLHITRHSLWVESSILFIINCTAPRGCLAPLSPYPLLLQPKITIFKSTHSYILRLIFLTL